MQILPKRADRSGNEGMRRSATTTTTTVDPTVDSRDSETSQKRVTLVASARNERNERSSLSTSSTSCGVDTAPIRRPKCDYIRGDAVSQPKVLNRRHRSHDGLATISRGEIMNQVYTVVYRRINFGSIQERNNSRWIPDGQVETSRNFSFSDARRSALFVISSNEIDYRTEYSAPIRNSLRRLSYAKSFAA